MGKHFKTSLRLLTCYSLDKVKPPSQQHREGLPASYTRSASQWRWSRALSTEILIHWSGLGLGNLIWEPQPAPAWPLGFLQLPEPGSLCWKMGTVRPTWGAVVTGRDHVCEGAAQCLARGRPLINDSCWHRRDMPPYPPVENRAFGRCQMWGDWRKLKPV